MLDGKKAYLSRGLGTWVLCPSYIFVFSSAKKITCLIEKRMRFFVRWSWWSMSFSICLLGSGNTTFKNLSGWVLECFLEEQGFIGEMIVAIQEDNNFLWSRAIELFLCYVGRYPCLEKSRSFLGYCFWRSYWLVMLYKDSFLHRILSPNWCVFAGIRLKIWTMSLFIVPLRLWYKVVNELGLQWTLPCLINDLFFLFLAAWCVKKAMCYKVHCSNPMLVLVVKKEYDKLRG